MFKHILVAVDGSESSRLALHEAAVLAREQQAQLRIVHVVDEVKVHWEMEFADLAALREAAIKSGREILNRAKLVAQDAGVEAEAKLLEIGTPGGRIADEIAQEAGAWPADLIVAGTHGRRGFNHLLMGSVAEGCCALLPRRCCLSREGEPSSAGERPSFPRRRRRACAVLHTQADGR